MISEDKTLKRDMVNIGFDNIIECRIITPEIMKNGDDDNLLLCILGDERKLNSESRAFSYFSSLSGSSKDLSSAASFIPCLLVSESISNR